MDSIIYTYTYQTDVDDEDKYPEIYRKTVYVKGSNLDVPKPFQIGTVCPYWLLSQLVTPLPFPPPQLREDSGDLHASPLWQAGHGS